ncbi:MAG TPA: hypothetical protein VK565_02835 [Gemmatimonadaceae bacterium]|nr:hypothetical protein [Gemmatimonadaceae bacterium]
MDENRFDEVIRDLPQNFKTPSEPPLDEMWKVIEDAHFNSPASTRRPAGMSSRAPWLAAAAALVIGIGIGHYVPLGKTQQSGNGAFSVASTQRLAAGADTSAIADAYRDQTSNYLGQAAALLISLPSQNASGKADAAFAGKAADLLVTTRLLMDSPAAQDPKLRSLLEDLELVLVQIARLRGERNKGDLDLIHQAVEQGDVLSRLNSAVVTNQSSE